MCFLIIGRKEADMIVHQADFSKGNVYKLVLRVSMPLIVAELVNLLYNMVDRIYIGHIPEVGSTALTGLGLCFPVISLISAFAKLFGVPMVARLYLQWHVVVVMIERLLL